MNNTKSFSGLSSIKTSKDQNTNESKRGITMRLLEKYKPNKGMPTAKSSGIRHEQIQAA